MRRLIALIAAAAATAVFVVPGVAVAAPTVGPDTRVSGQTYVRHDLGTDATIKLCNSEVPEDFGNFTQNNEPFSVVSPTNSDLVIAGWNDYCSDWMGLGFSTDGGDTWTNSLVPSYAGDTSTEGMASPEFGRTNAASDPVGAFNGDGSMFYFGSISFNGFAGHKTNSDVWVARYEVLDPGDPGYTSYPLDYLGTTQVGRGPAASNFFGIFNDKEMIEVDRTGGPHDGNLYECWTKFNGNGEPTIRFARSTDDGATFTKGINISGFIPGQGCDIAVEADGDVYVLWRDFEFSSSKKNFGVSVVRSDDGGLTFSKQPTKIANLIGYNPFDTARDCGDGAELCPSEFVFGRVPLEPRITSDPSGQLPGVYAIFNAVAANTVTASDTSYSSAGFSGGIVGQSFVYVSRSLNDGKTWSPPAKVDNPAKGHGFFPDGDAFHGVLAVVWQDSRNDSAYSVQLPVGNTTGATSSGGSLDTFVALSTNGTSFGSAVRVSSVSQEPQLEMFAARNVPFLGDYNWIQLMDTGDGLFGYLSWTDNRDVLEGPDPRETVQDGFDVHMCLDADLVNTCPNGGGFDQNIYGATIRIP